MSESGRNPLNKSTVNYLIVRYYERYTKNKSLVDFFRGFSVDDRIFLRTKRDLFMDRKNCRCQQDFTEVEIFAKNRPDSVEIQVFDSSVSPLSPFTDTDPSCDIEYCSEHEHEHEQCQTNRSESVSASSSTTSKKVDRLLEWDNSADIGYNNELLKFKSYSLPLLQTEKPYLVCDDSCQCDLGAPNVHLVNRPTTHERATKIGYQLNKIVNKPSMHKNKVIQVSPKKTSTGIQTTIIDSTSDTKHQKRYGKELRNNLEIIEDLLKKCDIRTKKHSVKYLKNLLDTNFSQSSSLDNESSDVVQEKTSTVKRKTTVYKITTEVSDDSTVTNSHLSTNSSCQQHQERQHLQKERKCGRCCCQLRKSQPEPQVQQPEVHLPPTNSKKTSSNKKERKPPIAYVMTFQEKTNLSNQKSDDELNLRPATYDLQEYLVKNRPDLIENAEKRRRHLMELMHARETRKNNINMHILEHVRSSMPEKENFVRTREMRLSSARKYTRLPEVQKRVRDMRLLQNRQANRIMTQIFNKKLQNEVLKGNTNLSNSLNVISHL